jgi:hypothetical protein
MHVSAQAAHVLSIKPSIIFIVYRSYPLLFFFYLTLGFAIFIFAGACEFPGSLLRICSPILTQRALQANQFDSSSSHPATEGRNFGQHNAT